MNETTVASETGALLARIGQRPSAEELARRHKAVEQIRRHQVSIAPLTVVELRREAREEEEASYERD